MTADHRQPQAFVLEDDKPVKSSSRHTRSKPAITFDQELAQSDIAIVPQTSSRMTPRTFRWGIVLLSALTSLIMMWAGLAVTRLVQSFFAQSILLGWLAFTVAAVAALAALMIVVRETWGLYRLRKLESLQEHAARAINLDDDMSARTTLAGLRELFAGRPELSTALRELATHQDVIMDPRDRVKLADRLLLTGLDDRVSKMIAKRARRVTLLTTVTPAAALDILFVAAQNIAMLREIAVVYGGRPSTLATLRLARMVVTHLAVAGGLALSDTFMQQFIGKGLLGRLSARFGEGAINGILTSRIGLAAAAVCRPIPKDNSMRSDLAKLLREIATPFQAKPENGTP
jgi:putative membrane protein